MAGGVTDQGPHHGPKFQVAYAVLAVVLAVAVTVTLYLLLRSSPAPQAAAPGRDRAWSSFVPTGTAGEQVQEIADHVGAEYRLPGGRQLVAVTPSFPPSYPVGSPVALPITQYVISYRPSASGAVDYAARPSSASVMYQLCGLGPKCSIDVGKASIARFEVLRRESLELALYTFRYVGANSVVTFMPPATGQKPQFAFLFAREAFTQSLARPLSATLTGPAPQPSQVTAGEQTLLNRLTGPSLYRFAYTQGQDGGVWLVFNPPSSPTTGGG